MAKLLVWLNKEDIEIIAGALEYRARLDHTVSAHQHMVVADRLRNPPLEPITSHDHNYQHTALQDGNNVLYCARCAYIVPLTKRGHAVTDNPA